MPNPFRVKVKKTNFKKNYFKDIYHLVLAATWLEFFVVVTCLYMSMNTFFATLYFTAGDSILNADPESFWDAFVFSFQTSATIGYGYMRPANTYTDIIVILDTLSGIIFVAITTGLAFAKFSKPTAAVLFTENAVIHPYEGKKTLFFRVANERDSHIADASIEASVVKEEQSAEGMTMQRIRDLKLVRAKSPIFSLSWTVMHVIDEDSPLYRLTTEEFKLKNVRIVISLTGIDDWSAQLVHATHLYKYSEIIYNKRFADILTRNPDESITMDYDEFNRLIDLPS